MRTRLLFARASVWVLTVIFLSVDSSADARKPNILMVVVDDLNLAIGCYGDEKAFTPNIDRLAARGTRFNRAHSQYPLCGPSRVSFLTGRRPESTGVYVLGTPARVALPNAVQLPELFKSHGYRTIGMGKIAHSMKTNDPKTWDRYEDGVGADSQENAAIHLRYEGGDGRPRSHVLDGDGSQTRDGMNAESIRQLISERSPDDSPFFYALGFHKPHLPWTAPKEHFDRHPPEKFAKSTEPVMQGIPSVAMQTELSGFEQPFDFAEAVRGYYACVSFIDSQLGRILDELERKNLIDSTIVVFFSDHGFHLGDHGGLWSKQSAFGKATQVPFILAGPGVPSGRVISSPTELIDLYPTLSELAGISTSTHLDGRSLRSLFGGEDSGSSFAHSLVYHYDARNRRDIEGRTVVADGWRYTEWNGGSAGTEFYLHSDDRGEYMNRANDASVAAEQSTARDVLRKHILPRQGPANRPRALLTPEKN
jgi:iduronate 2-sulfatase